MRIEHTIEIDAPVKRVWELTLDVESWPQLSPTFTSVERLDAGSIAAAVAHAAMAWRELEVSRDLSRLPPAPLGMTAGTWVSVAAVTAVAGIAALFALGSGERAERPRARTIACSRPPAPTTRSPRSSRRSWRRSLSGRCVAAFPTRVAA